MTGFVHGTECTQRIHNTIFDAHTPASSSLLNSGVASKLSNVRPVPRTYQRTRERLILLEAGYCTASAKIASCNPPPPPRPLQHRLEHAQLRLLPNRLVCRASVRAIIKKTGRRYGASTAAFHTVNQNLSPCETISFVWAGNDHSAFAQLGLQCENLPHPRARHFFHGTGNVKCTTPNRYLRPLTKYGRSHR